MIYQLDLRRLARLGPRAPNLRAASTLWVDEAVDTEWEVEAASLAEDWAGVRHLCLMAVVVADKDEEVSELLELASEAEVEKRPSLL